MSDNVKIAIDCRMLGKSGIGVYLQSILPYFIATPNIQLLLIGDQKVLQKYDAKNTEIISCNIPQFSIKEWLKFPVKEINACNVFYTPNFNIPRGIKIPVYSTIHDVVFLDVPHLSGYLGTIIRRFMLHRAIRLSKKIFTVSQYSRSRIIYHFGNKKEIIVSYNGITESLASFSSPKKIYNFPYLLFVGNIKKHKGLDILLSAYNRCVLEGDSPKLVIVGDAENFRTVDEVVKEILSQQSENTIFAGRVDNETLYSLMKYADALVQPSRYEGFGIPPLEAMYLGTPVIVSDIDVFKEIYGKFPVVFFKDGDKDDLAKRIKEIKPLSLSIEEIKELSISLL